MAVSPYQDCESNALIACGSTLWIYGDYQAGQIQYCHDRTGVECSVDGGMDDTVQDFRLLSLGAAEARPEADVASSSTSFGEGIEDVTSGSSSLRGTKGSKRIL